MSATDPISVVAILAGTVRLAVALLLFFAALPKLRDPLTFTGVVANYRVLPRFMAAPFARALPIAEIAVAIGLLLPMTARAASLAAATLLLAFAIAIGINIARGRSEIDCGCHNGDRAQPLQKAMVWRNVLIAAMLAASTFTPTITPVSAAAAAAFGLALAAGSGFYLLGHVIEQIWAIEAAARRRKMGS